MFNLKFSIFPNEDEQLNDDSLRVKTRSDRLINYFLISFFILGFYLASFYDTWNIAIGVGGTSMLAYYSTKWLLPQSDLYQYVLSTVLGIFMAQFIYQMHGLFEMHFFAFIGSAILITYQNWKLQIPMLLFVTLHHLGLNYLQSIGYGGVYFTSLDYLEAQAMTIHIVLTSVIFFTCGLWAYNLNKYNGHHLYMVNKIQERKAYEESLENLNAELRQSHQVAVEARKDAERSARVKSAFLATMSHEIRTPMNGVLGMTSLLKETHLNPEQADYVNVINTSGSALLNVINDVLDYSKIEAGQMELNTTSFNFQQCVEDVISLFEHKARKENLILAHEIEDRIPKFLIGDSLKLRQILINLVGNALKFTSAGSVHLKVEQQDLKADKIVLGFDVSDTGIGIAKEKLPRLFKAFSQLDSSKSRKYEGTGLGLAICERLVEMMKGKITVKSKENEGTTFSFTVEVLVDADKIRQSQIDRNLQPKLKPVLDPGFASRCPLQILLAEDNPINMKLALAILNKLGYSPDFANDGEEAVEQFKNKHYDLILMDVMMPKMNGLQATKKIRTFISTQPTIIAMTASIMPEDKINCLEAGMDDYLSKPIDLELFLKALKKTASLRNSIKK